MTFKKTISRITDLFSSLFLSLLLGVLLEIAGISLWAQDALIEERKKLDQVYKKLQIELWKVKKDQLQQRKIIKDQISFSDERIKTLYERRNSLVEEEFIIEENIAQTEENWEDTQKQYQILQGQVAQTLEQETIKLQSMFPVAIEKYSDRLNKIKAIPIEQKIQKKITELINYKQNLIKQGQQVEFYLTKIYQPDLNDSLSAQVIRIGWIQSYYRITDIPQNLQNSQEVNPIGILIRESDLSGVRYRWQKVPKSSQQIIEDAIHQGVNLLAQESQDKKSDFIVPVDPIQSGKKLRSFLNDQSLSVFKLFSNFFISGGVIMYPLFLLLFWALFLIVEKIVQMNRYRMKKLTYLDQIKESLQTQNFLQTSSAQIASGNPMMDIREKTREKIEKILSSSKETEIKPLVASLFHTPLSSLEEIEKLMSDQLAPLVFKLEKRLSTLSIIASVAPLLGLLGTVTGMIQLFDIITLYGTSNPKILAGGISVALITTQTGLAIAVPILITHHFLVRIKNRFLMTLETKISTIINLYHSLLYNSSSNNISHHNKFIDINTDVSLQQENQANDLE